MKLTEFEFYDNDKWCMSFFYSSSSHNYCDHEGGGCSLSGLPWTDLYVGDWIWLYENYQIVHDDYYCWDHPIRTKWMICAKEEEKSDSTSRVGMIGIGIIVCVCLVIIFCYLLRSYYVSGEKEEENDHT
eukprot:UN20402